MANTIYSFKWMGARKDQEKEVLSLTVCDQLPEFSNKKQGHVMRKTIQVLLYSRHFVVATR